MTEEEAKTKWCPFARTLDWDTIRVDEQAHPVAASVNRAVGNYDSIGDETVIVSGRHRCIGAGCMAWRGKPTADFTEAKALAASDRRIDAIRALRVVLPGLSLKEAKDIVCGDAPWPVTDGGFCGLAGAPQ